ncbi:MAG: response regulator [bacterium]|nr:response regulator [bacterium]
MSEQPTVLLIEDEKVLVDMYRQVFERYSKYNLLTANDKTAGRDLAIKHLPDVVLLDLIIPEEANGDVSYQDRVGFDLLEEIRQHPKAAKLLVFIFSNIDTHEDRMRSDQLGAAEYLLKAEYSPERLIKKLNTALKKNSRS